MMNLTRMKVKIKVSISICLKIRSFVQGLEVEAEVEAEAKQFKLTNNRQAKVEYEKDWISKILRGFHL